MMDIINHHSSMFLLSYFHHRQIDESRKTRTGIIANIVTGPNENTVLLT